MSSSLTLHESQHLAEEMYALLRSLDPARWRQDMAPAIRQRLEAVRDKLYTLLEETEWPSTFDNLRVHLTSLQQILQESLAQKGELSADYWNGVRMRLLPVYEGVAASLKVQSIHVPSLRPTNYTRNIFHVLSGLSVLMILHHTFAAPTLVWVGLAAACMAWSMEFARRRSERVNQFLMKVFGSVAHPHEQHRVNSATWYTTALFLLAWLFPPIAGSLAVIILGVSDPSAALVGRRFGKRRLVAGRTLEGSGAFVVVGLVASMVVMSIYHNDLLWWQMLLVGFSGTICGAIAEMVSERVDDNFSIPMSVAVGVASMGWLLGL